jgi:hypothetical protein
MAHHLHILGCHQLGMPSPGPWGPPSTPPSGANGILKGEGKYNILKDIFHIMQVCSNMQLFNLISLSFK